MFSTKVVKQTSQPFHKSNPKETLQQVSTSVATYTQKETKANMKQFWEQLLGAGEYKSKTAPHGEMHDGEAIFFSKEKQGEQLSKEAPSEIRSTIANTEVLHDDQASKKENAELSNKLDAIIDELKRLSTASIILEKEVTQATGQTIVTPGKYHVNFFEWLLIEISQARMQVEDAGAWLVTVSSKSSKKQYWARYKEEGAKFGLSGEHAVSRHTA